MPKLADGTLTKSFGWAASGTALQISAQVVTLIWLARLLSPTDFGIVSIATLVTQLGLVFAEFGVAPYVVQKLTLDEKVLGLAFRLSCALGLALTLLTFLTAPLFAAGFDVRELEPVLRVYSIVFAIKGWSSVQEALIQRSLDFRFLARSEGWSFVLGYGVVSIVCALSGWTYWSLVAGHLAQTVIKAGFVVYRHPNVPSLPVCRGSAREMLDFGAGQTLARLGSYLGSQADSFVVASSLGIAPIGYYGRANQLVTMPAFYVGQVFDKVIFPATAIIQADRGQVSRSYLTALGAVLLLTVPIAIGVFIFSLEIVDVLLGSEWHAVAAPMGILALAIPFRMIHKVSDPTARALGATYSRAWRQWLFAALVAIGATLAIPHGLAGIAVVVMIACGLDAILMSSLCMKLTGQRLSSILHTVVPAVHFGLVTLVASLAGLWSIKLLGFPSWLTLLTSGVLVCSTLLFIAWIRPRFLWGSAGVELIDLVLGRRR